MRLTRVIVLLFCLASCRREQPRAVLARVGEGELTLETAKQHIDTTRGSIEAQLQLYVASWINGELIALEAKRNGVERSEQFIEKNKDAQRQIANQIFLDQYFSSDAGALSDTTLTKYYDTHKAEFFVREKMIKLNVLLFSSRERASAFAAGVVQIGNWDAVMHKFLTDSSRMNTITMMPTQYYSQHTLYPPELWKVASTLNMNEVSFPVKTSSGYAVLQPVASVQEGKPADYELVRDEVRERALMERRRNKYDELIGNLRKRYHVEVLLPIQSQPDSTQSRVNE